MMLLSIMQHIQVKKGTGPLRTTTTPTKKLVMTLSYMGISFQNQGRLQISL
jgi:hypothetical protein